MMRRGVDWRRMAQKRFVVHLKDGTVQPILAESGDEDEEADGYVFFVDSDGGIAASFHNAGTPL